jgi:decaprenyl-phosphate phosphoribosyltransferase
VAKPGTISAERAEDRRSEPPVSGVESPPAPVPVEQISLLRRVRGIVRTMRPHQWVKNLFVVAPVVFAKQLGRPELIKGGIGAFAIFCMLASAVYALNDLVDADADRVHPVKRHRPIASGVVSVATAKAMVIALVVAALGAAGAFLPLSFLLVAVGYLANNLAYSFGMKKVPYLDVMSIAGGFVLRVYAGGFATNTPVSGYMIACTAFLALFLGFGKRMHELAGANAAKQRAALERYSPNVILAAMSLTGLASVVTYALYSVDPHTRAFFASPDGLERWLWLTSIHPLVGVLRFVFITRRRTKAESPTQEMLRDVPFMLNLVVWIAEVVVIVYRLRPT